MVLLLLAPPGLDTRRPTHQTILPQTRVCTACQCPGRSGRHSTRPWSWGYCWADARTARHQHASGSPSPQAGMTMAACRSQQPPRTTTDWLRCNSVGLCRCALLSKERCRSAACQPESGGYGSGMGSLGGFKLSMFLTLQPPLRCPLPSSTLLECRVSLFYDTTPSSVDDPGVHVGS